MVSFSGANFKKSEHKSKLFRSWSLYFFSMDAMCLVTSPNKYTPGIDRTYLFTSKHLDIVQI